jgi:broad specificity phosphatase PhoE
VDVARSESVEVELSRLIEERSFREMDPDEREELWKESVRRYNARRREEMRAAWQEYHQGQAARHRAVLESLIARHEGEAARLEATEPKGAA